MKNKHVTIKQVAEKAGVALGTVSHVLNGTAPISAETEARVREAITELNYVPNITARSLRSKHSKMIGILVPNLNNSFYSRILSTFTDLAFAEGYVVQIFGYEYSIGKELQILHTLSGNSLDVVIILNGCGDEEGIRKLMTAGKQVILADRISSIDGINSIRFDNRQGVSAAVRFLKQKGYRRIGYLSEPLSLSNVNERMLAFRESFRKQYDQEPSHIFLCEDFRLDALQNGYRYMKELLNSRQKSDLPDSFLATSDLLAMGAIKACRELGYKVPGDFGFISFDNLDISPFVSPALTTIEQNQVQMGTELFDLVCRLQKDNTIKAQIVLPQTLIVRESC